MISDFVNSFAHGGKAVIIMKTASQAQHTTGRPMLKLPPIKSLECLRNAVESDTEALPLVQAVIWGGAFGRPA